MLLTQADVAVQLVSPPCVHPCAAVSAAPRCAHAARRAAPLRSCAPEQVNLILFIAVNCVYQAGRCSPYQTTLATLNTLMWTLWNTNFLLHALKARDGTTLPSRAQQGAAQHVMAKGAPKLTKLAVAGGLGGQSALRMDTSLWGAWPLGIIWCALVERLRLPSAHLARA